MPSGDEKVVRRRNKPSLTCTNCRSRKTKCDRKTPCSSCVQGKRAGSCTYDMKWQQTTFKVSKDERVPTLTVKTDPLTPHETTSTSTLTPDSKDSLNNERLNLRTSKMSRDIANPVAAPEETINLNAGYNPVKILDAPRRMHFGPLSWVSLLKKDPWLHHIWTLPVDHMSRDCIFPYLADEPSKLRKDEKSKNDRDTCFRKMALEQDRMDDISLKMVSGQLSEKNSMFMRSLNFTRQDSDPTLNEIKKIMPSQKTIWILVDRFFERVYPFIPLIDEDFKNDVAKIIGGPCYEDIPVSQVKVEKKADIAIIGLLLFLLRITYLLHISNRSCVNEYIVLAIDPGVDQKTKHILSNPVNYNVVGVANSCIQCFSLNRPSLQSFQAMLFSRFHEILAPEGGGLIDSGDYGTSTGILIQTANALGMNREPDYFDSSSETPKMENICRKIWFFLMRIERLNINNMGDPMIIDDNRYDTKPPYVTEENSNIFDVEKERAVVRRFNSFNDFIQSIVELSKLILNVRVPPRINELTRVLEEIDYVSYRDLYCLESLEFKDWWNITYLQQCCAVSKSKIFLNLRNSLLTVYYNLFLHYETRDYEFAIFYLIKIYRIFVREVVPFFIEVVKGKLSNFGYFINPAIQMVIQKANQITGAICARAHYAKILMGKNPSREFLLENDVQWLQRSQAIDRLITTKRRLSEALLKVLEEFSKRYYSAWRLSKAQRYMLKCIDDKKFYEVPETSEKPLPFPTAKLEELSDIVLKATLDIEQIFATEDSVSKFPDMNISRDATSMMTSTDCSTSDELPDPQGPGGIDELWLQMMAIQNAPVEDRFLTSDPYSYDSGKGSFAVPEKVDSNSYLNNIRGDVVEPDDTLLPNKFDYEDFISSLLGRDLVEW